MNPEQQVAGEAPKALTAFCLNGGCPSPYELTVDNLNT